MKTKLLLSALLFVVVQLSYGQWTYTNLSEPKTAMGCTSLGNEAWFAGGYNGGVIDTVEVYDVITQQRKFIGHLSVARMNAGAVACGTKVFIGGGAVNMSTIFSQVDIYDTTNKQWSAWQLAEPRFLPSAVSDGNQVLFAGGLTNWTLSSSNVVDIYDSGLGLWSTDFLSIERGAMASAVVGDLAIFAGGFINQSAASDQVDIYHFSTKSWSTCTLSEPRAFCEATVVGNKVLIAGGIKAMNEPSKVVDIYDASTDTWDTDSLSVPRALARAATVDGKAYFAGGATFNFGWHDFSNVIDIYDGKTGTWSVDTMIVPRIALVTGVGDYLVIAGGEISATELTDLVEIYTVIDGVASSKNNEEFIKVYPNPGTGNFHFEIFKENLQKPLLANIYNMQGKVVNAKVLASSERELNVNLPTGIYLLRIIADEKTYSKLITIQK